MRSRRLSVTLTTEDWDALRVRAAAHGMSMSRFMRTAALGDFTGSRSRHADEWWDALPPVRRQQVHGWLHKNPDTEAMPGQTSILDDVTQPRRA